jgi:hypothetical protein
MVPRGAPTWTSAQIFDVGCAVLKKTPHSSSLRRTRKREPPAMPMNNFAAICHGAAAAGDFRHLKQFEEESAFSAP